MKTLYIDCSSGASGDMMLGAFLDLGVPERVLREGLASLGLEEFRLEVRKKERNGQMATDVDVILLNEKQAWAHPYSGKYRNYGDIEEMIESSSLAQKVKQISKRIFDIKAQAEAEVHGVAADQVQFHEAGAVDSIVDIVGTAICYNSLDIDLVVSRSVPTGYGTIQCACGELPVPAPAVKKILEHTGLPNYRSDVGQELLTPTGASILAALVDEFTPGWNLPVQTKSGFGTGKRDTGLPPLKLCLAEEHNWIAH